MRRYKVFFGTGCKIVVSALHTYVISSAGNASCHKNHYAIIAMDHHVTIGWNAVAKATANF